jgi:hypothetical protein
VWITGGEKPSKKLFRLEPTRTSFECGLETLQDFTRIDMLLNREAVGLEEEIMTDLLTVRGKY